MQRIVLTYTTLIMQRWHLPYAEYTQNGVHCTVLYTEYAQNDTDLPLKLHITMLNFETEYAQNGAYLWHCVCTEWCLPFTLSMHIMMLTFDTEYAHNDAYLWHWVCKEWCLHLTLSKHIMMLNLDTEYAQKDAYLWHWVCNDAYLWQWVCT